MNNWINLWDIRKYNILPACTGSEHSSMKLAEPGLSSFMWDHQLSLVNVAYSDSISMMMKISEYEEFVVGDV